MDSKQKQIIMKCWYALLVSIALVLASLAIASYYTPIPQVLVPIASIVSPSMIIGVLIKVWINQRNLKAIDNHLAESGIKPLQDIKQSSVVSKNDLKDYFHWKDFHVKLSKNKMVITFTPRNEIDFYKDFKKFDGELVEKIRKDLPTQLI